MSLKLIEGGEYIIEDNILKHAPKPPGETIILSENDDLTTASNKIITALTNANYLSDADEFLHMFVEALPVKERKEVFALFVKLLANHEDSPTKEK